MNISIIPLILIGQPYSKRAMNLTPIASVNGYFFHEFFRAKVQSTNHTPLDVSYESAPWDDPIIAPLLVLWLYLPGYLSNTAAMLGGKWIPEISGMKIYPIDGGRSLADGNRILGDGKTWNGLLGGTIGGGFLGLITHSIAKNNSVSSAPFLDPLGTYAEGGSQISEYWFYLGGELSTAFALGCILGFGCMFGDSAGSLIKRRLGHLREGSESSEAPLLDTLPFAVSTFIFGQTFLDPSIVSSPDLLLGMVILLLATPIIHRSFNILGYKLGLKSVPY